VAKDIFRKFPNQYE
jgi:AP-1 complex subunit beta-1